MSLLTKTFYLLLLILFSANEINAQVKQCNGALGDPVINNDFGRGSAHNGNPTPQYTNYPYMLGTPNDGWYTIVKNTFGMHPGNWHQITNHTPNDASGYMMVVNSNENPSVFYENKISGLCAGTTYQFSAWIINLLTYSGKKPNVTFTIETSNGNTYTYNTGDINEGGPTDWKEYKMLFTTTNNDDIIIKMMNNGPGGNGNDIALDDIIFRACGPIITPSINNAAPTASLCAGESAIYNLAATVSPGYTNPSYQWQVNSGTGWTNLNLPDAQSTQVTVPYSNAIAGTYNYQLLVAEGGNIISPNCRIVSSPLTITVSANPILIASYTGLACEGSDVTLTVNSGAKFLWTGPNGFTSTLQNPSLTNLLPNQSGIYTVLVTNVAGCSSTSNVTLQVLPKPIVLTNIPNNVTTICDNNSIQLNASGGTSYRWEPTEELSNPLIANPVASPKKTTNYTVFVSNGACTVTTSVLINVTKSAKANAGADQKALAGESVNLEGKVSGDNITYLWSPPDYLDDATKLNPIATPPKDMVYTLSVQSACRTSTDNVFVKIYPKVEIKNTFTPNGDGKNDTWNITALEAFPTHKIKVVNRNGQTVFNNKGSYLPWDGKFNQKDVPVGSYYYTIYLNDDFKTLSGWVFVMR